MEKGRVIYIKFDNLLVLEPSGSFDRFGERTKCRVTNVDDSCITVFTNGYDDNTADRMFFTLRLHVSTGMVFKRRDHFMYDNGWKSLFGDVAREAVVLVLLGWNMMPKDVRRVICKMVYDSRFDDVWTTDRKSKDKRVE